MVKFRLWKNLKIVLVFVNMKPTAMHKNSVSMGESVAIKIAIIYLSKSFSPD